VHHVGSFIWSTIYKLPLLVTTTGKVVLVS